MCGVPVNATSRGRRPSVAKRPVQISEPIENEAASSFLHQVEMQCLGCGLTVRRQGRLPIEWHKRESFRALWHHHCCSFSLALWDGRALRTPLMPP